MVCRGKRDELLALTPADVVPVLHRKLESDLRRGRTGVGIERLSSGSPERSPSADPPAASPAHSPGPSIVRVRDLVELIPNRVIDLANAMPVNVAPQRRDAVQIAPAVRIDQMNPLTRDDHQRLRFQPQLHRRKRMPDVAAIELAEMVGLIGHCVGRVGLRADRAASTVRTEPNPPEALFNKVQLAWTCIHGLDLRQLFIRPQPLRSEIFRAVTSTRVSIDPTALL